MKVVPEAKATEVVGSSYQRRIPAVVVALKSCVFPAQAVAVGPTVTTGTSRIKATKGVRGVLGQSTKEAKYTVVDDRIGVVKDGPEAIGVPPTALVYQAIGFPEAWTERVTLPGPQDSPSVMLLMCTIYTEVLVDNCSIGSLGIPPNSTIYP